MKKRTRLIMATTARKLARATAWSALALSPLVPRAQDLPLADSTVYTTCSGTLYDSGGAGGPYQNNEDITTTLCPQGGPGSGALTTVQFTAWQLAPGAGDQLSIHDGVGTTGTLLATGTAANPLLGQTFTASAPEGCLTFRFLSNATGTAAGWAAIVLTGPDAGEDGQITVCSNAPAVDLHTLLGGTPDAGGAWYTPSGGPHSGTYDPASEQGGDHAYVVTTAGCPSDTAIVSITRILAPNAGTSGAIALCADDAPFGLINALGGAPSAGGTWTGPAGAHNGVFVPGTHPPGPYVYTVTGTPPCTDATATVTVTVHAPPHAGENAALDVCATDTPFDLFDMLGGTPDEGGAWTGPDASPVGATFNPASSPEGTYTYTVVGLPPCDPATATVTVNVVAAAHAGTDAGIVVCGNEPPFAMVDELGGTPQTDGTWTGPGGPHGPTFDPATDDAGPYVYTVPGDGPCPAVAATLTIGVSTPPHAGSLGDTLVCSNNASFGLFQVLNDAPSAGGAWTYADAPHTGIFEPGVSLPGPYTYTVTGPAPCAPATAVVTVAVTTAPQAGLNSTVVRCSNDDPVDLFAELGGAPDDNGSWAGPGGAHSGQFQPATDPQGPYIYTVQGDVPCADATAIVTTVVVAAPDPGLPGTITVCSNDGPVDLFSLLGGTPDGNGGWWDPDDAAHGTTYLPGSHLPGTYRYVVPGIAPCVSLETTVTVTEVPAPDPGTNGSITVCSSDDPVDLFDLLGGTPDAGGSWTRPNGQPHTGTYLPGSQSGGTYTYTVPGTGPCDSLSASVQVVRVIAPRAGTDGSTVVCSTNGPFPLISMLGGTPDGNGAWSDLVGNALPGTFTPGVSAPGGHMYVVPGTAPCLNDTSYVTVNVNIAPVAGTNASTTVCSADDPFDLIDVLGGSPDPGGSWTDPVLLPHTDPFDPGTDLPGGYTYTVAGEAPCNNASAVVVVNVKEQRSAGLDASFERCSTDAPVNLFSILGGAPATGGQWQGPSPVPGGFFNPATNTPGAYSYIVTSEAPCVTDTAIVTAVVNPAPNAGSDAEITICSVQDELDLFDVLGGTPDLNGTWTEVETSGQLSGSIFSTLGLSPGTYHFHYTVPGIGVCGDDVATVTVTTVPGLDAGDNGVLTVCRNNTSVNLFNGLGGAPQSGGTWIDLGGTNALSGQHFNAMQVPPGSYNFRYLLTGALACTSDSALVTVGVVDYPDPGVPSTLTACSDGAAFNMFTFLGGIPDAGGQWRRGAINGPLVSNVYNPVLHPPDTYYYIVSGNGPCADSAAWLVVTEVPAPNPGQSGSMTVCASDAPFNMTDALGGTPDAGGQWHFNTQEVDPTYVPGQNSPGTYTYRVPGPPACGFRESQLTVNVQPAINAGNNTTETVCSNTPAFNLFNLLGGGAQFEGHWTDPDNAPHTGQFNPASDQEGTYTYTLPDSAACPGDQATVSVFVNQQADAGIGGMVQLCNITGTTLNLSNALGGNPDPVGTWAGPLPQLDPMSGIFVVGVTPPGTYRYRVAGAWPCTADSAEVTVQLFPQANAGTSRTILICDNAPAFGMVDSLGGAPAIGAWHGPGAGGPPMNGLFFPGTTAPGTYYYTVNSPNCPSATASLQVLLSPAPNAGNDTSVTTCDSDASFDLFPLLGGDPHTGGSWYDPSGALHNGTVHPATAEPGPYKYKITGQWPCASDSAIVQVTINRTPTAGCSAVTTVCSSGAPFQLHGLLTCTPDPLGQWTAPGQPPTPHSGTFVPGQDPPGGYTFTVDGPPGCPNATATVTVVVSTAVSAGTGSTEIVCSDANPFMLHDLLTGETTGGTWYDPQGAVTSFEYTPGQSQPGDYKYKVTGQAPCPADSSTVTVVEVAAVNAGINTQAHFCSTDALVPLIDLLGGNPTPGGTWTYEEAEHGPNYDPEADLTGAYIYTVTGIPPCQDKTAQVYITNSAAPVPGGDGTITVCIGQEEVPLDLGITGDHDAGGTWDDVDGTGLLNGGILQSATLPPGEYHFVYTVEGEGVCADSSATVTVLITDGLNPGLDSTVEACLGELVDLFAVLGGQPQPGGFWTGEVGSALVGGVFNTALVEGGSSWEFLYTLPASSLCPSASAKVTVHVVEGPYAGCDANLPLCSSDAAVDMLGQLGCGPQTTGSWYTADLVPHAGTFDPADAPGGIFLYVVPAVGLCPADTAQLTISVVVAPDAGANADLSICSDQDAVDMFTLLGPDAQAGGSWTKVPNTPHTGIYDPALDTPGSFSYEVPGQAPCPTQATAFVTVTEPQAPNAGCDTEIALCSTSAIINMRLNLDCSPPTGGSWFGPGMVPWSGNLFDPAAHAEGDYTHVMPGTAPCANDTAVLNISVTQQADPGQSATVNACLSQTELDLWPLLGPFVQMGGAWTDVSGSGALADSLFNPSVAGAGTWTVHYGFPSNGPCPAVHSQIEVVVGAGVDPGIDGTVLVCGADLDYALISGLGGDPDEGGTWAPITGGGEALGPDGTLNATLLAPGTEVPYLYTVSDPACGDLSAVLTVIISAYPDPGIGPDGDLVHCTTSDPFALDVHLVGAPSDTGTWTGPGGLPHGGLIDPATDLSGTYVYTVNGNAACPDSSAYVQVTINSPPDPGMDGSVQVCDTLTALELFPLLGGDPQSGGTWIDLTGSGGLSAGTLNTAGLAPGNYAYGHVAFTPGCPTDTAQVEVTVVGNLAVVDLERICNEQDRTYTVRFTITDGDPATYMVTGLAGALSGEAPYVFTSEELLTSQTFAAWVQDANACGTVHLEGGTPCDFEVEVFIPQSFSPNGDNINDSFVIPGIEGYPLNRITIYNRWGGLMYQAEGYDNRTVVWDGTPADALFGGDAPSGTYYYILELGPGSAPFTGYVQLVR